MAISRYGGVTGTAKISEDYENINVAFNNVATESDERQGEVTEHVEDTQIHLSPTDRTKLDSVEPDAEPNQNAVARINDVTASTPTDQFFIVGGLGITVSTNPTTKQITVTATGETAPAAHGSTHNIGGADEIPDLREAFDNAEDALTKANLVETLVNDLQTDVNQLESHLTTHTATEVHEGEAHGLRVNPTTLDLEYFNGTTWVTVSTDIGDNVITSTTAAINYYVDAVSGNDSNDGSSGSPFKTIMHAVDLIPKYLRHDVTINVIAGTYDEDVVISGFLGAKRLLLEASGTVSQGSHNIKSITVTGCKKVSIQKFTITGVNGTYGMQIASTTFAEIISIYSIATKAYGIKVIDGSTALIVASVFSNTTTAAMGCERGSQLLSQANSGTGNNVVLSAFGGIILKNTTQPSGATAEVKNAGGQIF